jgi:hypothetical protein
VGPAAIWSRAGVWYGSQKEHWLGCLAYNDGPGAYGRKTWKGRSAGFVYNHVKCPPMLLWLAEAAGIPKDRLARAKRTALAAAPNLGSHAAALRRVIPWPDIEARLGAVGRSRRSIVKSVKKAGAEIGP